MKAQSFVWFSESRKYHLLPQKVDDSRPALQETWCSIRLPSTSQPYRRNGPLRQHDAEG
ncbi:hypothetical protein I552_3705 [Mycobacterium xenopi 3993]|nr:hypothetical protein I552_3705 [Mycobacterium xenopi 3993]